MNKTIITIIIGIIVLVGAYSLFVSNNKEEVVSTQIPEIKEFNGQIKEFDITAKNWDFTPSTIEVNQGDKIIINLMSIDVSHGINIPELGVNLVVGAGETKTTEFIAGKKGEFSFSCNVYCGEGHSSMRGKLVVK